MIKLTYIICGITSLLLIFNACEHNSLRAQKSEIKQEKDSIFEPTIKPQDIETPDTVNLSENNLEPVDSTDIIKKDSIVSNTVETEINDKKKYIYLTFDDGPNAGTGNLITVLKKHKIPSTFFLIGRNVSSFPNAKRDLAELNNSLYFQVANHSYSHANNKYRNFYSNPENVLKDFNRARDSIREYTLISRLPGRNTWRTPGVNTTDLDSRSAADLLEENGYKLLGWDIEWGHKNMKLNKSGRQLMNEIDYIFKNNNTRIKNHMILLTHDQYFNDQVSPQKLDSLIVLLKQRDDIEIRLIKDYPGLHNKVND